MAEVEQKDSGGKKKGKQKKMNIRVDFTPMVDMNMLLLTFFMLCTSMSKPQTMEISMPSNDKTLTEQERDKVAASRAITLILAYTTIRENLIMKTGPLCRKPLIMMTDSVPCCFIATRK